MLADQHLLRLAKRNVTCRYAIDLPFMSGFKTEIKANYIFPCVIFNKFKKN